MDDPYKRIFGISVEKDADLSSVQSNKLLCCPFCGSEPKVENIFTSFFGPKEWVIGCSQPLNCHASPTVSHRYRMRAIKFWNLRAT